MASSATVASTTQHAFLAIEKKLRRSKRLELSATSQKFKTGGRTLARIGGVA